MIRSLLALPFEFVVVYVLMISAPIVLCFRKARAALARVSLLAILFSFHTYMPRGGTNFVTKWEFEKTFYGHPTGAVRAGSGLLRLANDGTVSGRGDLDLRRYE